MELILFGVPKPIILHIDESWQYVIQSCPVSYDEKNDEDYKPNQLTETQWGTDMRLLTRSQFE